MGSNLLIERFLISALFFGSLTVAPTAGTLEIARSALVNASATGVGATSPSAAYAYTYDALGNRLTETPGSLAASSWAYWTGNQDYLETTTPSGGTAQTIGNDGIGDITAVVPQAGETKLGPSASFTYNQANRMATSAVTSMAPQVYAYDWEGRMLTRSVTSTTPAAAYQYQYGQDGMLLEEQASGIPSQDYVWIDGEPLAAVTPSSGTVTYLVTDRLKQPRIGVQPSGKASAGTVVWEDAVLPFGVVTAVSSPVALQMDLRLPGQVADPNGGWVHNGARDYMPAWGRYLEIDPLRLGGGSFSLFGYTRQNPLRWTDRTGLNPIIDELPEVIEIIEEESPAAESAIAAIENASQNAEEWVDSEIAAVQKGGDGGNAANIPCNQYVSKIDRTQFASQRPQLWRDEATNNPDDYSVDQISNMNNGRAPMGDDGYPMEFHHVDGTPDGEIIPMTRTDHRYGGNYFGNHPWLKPSGYIQ